MYNVKIPYTVRLLSQAHTGADISRGITKEFRRMKVITGHTTEVKSLFPNDNLRRKAIALILFRIYEEIKDKARMTILDEFSAAVMFAARNPKISDFLQDVTSRMQTSLNNVHRDGRLPLIQLLDAFEDDKDFLITIRSEHEYIMRIFRELHIGEKDLREKKVEAADQKKKNKGMGLMFGEPEEIEWPAFTDYQTQIENEVMRVLFERPTPRIEKKPWEDVPYFSGNSIKGIMRRLVMEDFAEKVGLDFSETAYHRLFTGGAITESSGNENIQRKRAMVELCPMLGLFGSAVEDGTIPAQISVTAMFPLCKELGTADYSHNDVMDMDFGTRLDSSKLTQSVKINFKEQKQTQQMFYKYEVMATGTRLDGTMSVITHSEIILSAFARAVNLFKQNAHIGAKGTVGLGNIEFENLELPEGVTEDLYLQYLEDNKQRILSYAW